MEPAKQDDFDLKKMIADYMENGLLDNIIDMYKHDKSLYEYIGYLMSDERMRVRIGATALIEIMKDEDPENISKAIPSILPLLKSQSPVTRGDIAYLLGVIGSKETIRYLNELLNDEDMNVKTSAQEAIEDIHKGSR
ncbi:MAG: HEAT repeat domain-containing protein [Thermodesulfovibrionales bacterium]|nr:HEAT repeat domain-containing protein [Thermodesulfovibrionales bacterium]